MGAKHCSGIQPGLHFRAPPRGTTTHTPVLLRTAPADRGRGQSTSPKRGCIGDTAWQPGRVLLKPIPGTQKRRRAETSDKSQALKPVPPGRTLQDGRDTYPKGHCKARRLARESRPEGCLLHHPNPPIPQGVSKVQISGHTIPVQLPPIWPLLGTLGLYQRPSSQ